MFLHNPLRGATLALLALSPLAVSPAHADSDAGDKNYFRFGVEHVLFHDDNPGFQGPGIPPGLKLQTQTEDLNSIYLSYARDITDHVEAQFAFGVPPEFHVHGRGPSAVGSVPFNGQPLSSGRQMSPSLSINYKFNAPGAFYRPYVGLGLVYSHFFDLKVTPQASAVNGGPTSVTYTDSWGFRATLGVALKITDHWYGTVSLTRADIKPTATLHTLGVDRANEYQLNPVVYAAALSYGF